MAISHKDVVWFSEVGKDDIAVVGGKGANLGEMTRAKFPVPPGFILTSKAYYNFLKQNNLATKIKNLLGTANFQNSDSLRQVSLHIKREIMHGIQDQAFTKEVYAAYRQLGGVFSDPLVAVRSSATAEDLPGASFAGQQATFLNVHGEANLLVKIKEGWASLFEPRAIFYRHEQKFDHFKIGIAIVVQKMVASESSGIMFTIDPVTNDKSKVVIEAIFGLGEYIVGGVVTPDHYEIEKQTEKITHKDIVEQKIMLERHGGVNKETRTPKIRGNAQKIPDKVIKELAEIGKKLEHHYFFPQDIEWAYEKGIVYIVQTRAITTIGKEAKMLKETNRTQETKGTKEHLPLIAKGSPASPGIGTGPARVIQSAKEIGKVLPGDVLVAPQTNPDYVPAMKKAVAIVTTSGGRTSHAAIVSRELGIPAVVGVPNATKLMKTGEVVTVNGMLGEIYKGGSVLPSSTTHLLEPEEIIKTATKVYVNLAEPELASSVSRKQADGIGLLRAEFMIAGIGTHPKKMIHDGKKQVFIEKLANNLEMFCKAFTPRPVVYRATDFKTNEYRSLIGEKEYEPVESNPMLGYRGVYRYIHDSQVFDLEIEAIKRVRNKLGYKNLWLMLPFVRTVAELIEVKKILSSQGLHRTPSFRLWMMVEIPANVILLDKFIGAGIDGVSIGSNDLTMLILGTDRDNAEVAQEFNERDDAVLWALERTIKIANKYGITSSLCGQAASMYPDLVEKLVRWGITSVSVSPDAIVHTRKSIHIAEKKLITKE